ncbi:MAG: ATP-binding protein, partial [Gammaproteobacteria bacterium]|nr:ATP-binding protein [Gammaproteobacteria bacterium]
MQQLLRVVSLFTFFTILQLPAHAESNFQVLVVHAYAQEYPWTKSQHLGFVERLNAGSSLPLNVTTEYLDTKRLQMTAEYTDTFVTYLRSKYRDYQPDVIYVTDDNGFIFARDFLADLFPTAPVFFSGVNDYAVLPQLEDLPMRGVFEKKDIAANLRLLQQLDNRSNEILVVGDGSNTSDAIEHEIKQQLQQLSHIQATFVNGPSMPDVLATLTGRTEKLLFLTTIGGMKDSNDKTLTIEQTISGIESAGEFAVISMEDAYILDEVLGGYVTNGRSQGQAAADLVLDFQSGKSLANIRNITESPNLYMFNKARLDQLDIRLPVPILHQSEFVNIPRSFYEQNRQLILTTIFVLVITVLSLLVIFYQTFQRRKRETIRVRRLRTQRIEKYQNALMEWSGVNYKNLDEAFRKATEISADTLDVSRVSIWLFSDERSAIECQDMYSQDEGHSSGQELKRVHYPKYFTAMEMGRQLVINDARRDLITAAFNNNYLQPNNIFSMLDIPIYFQGEVVGVVCHEHQGRIRHWANHEQDFATAIAGNVSLSLEVERRKSIEHNLALAKKEAEQASQAKSEFLATMSHEIRTPMNGVSGMASLLLDSELDTEQQHYVRVIHDSADALITIINDILDFSRLEAHKLELEESDFNLRNLVADVVDIFESHAAAKQIEFVINLPESSGLMFKGDPGRIRQILMNLVGNAVKFTETGQISIAVKVTHEDKVNCKLMFEVTDTGIGIEADKTEHLFESFVQSDASVTSKYGGSGLGLAITKRLVEAMSGFIDVESEPGKGSRFWFEIALRKVTATEQQVMEPAASVMDYEAINHEPMRILVVEDVVPNQIVARKLIEKFGHRVDIAGNGIEAVEAVKNRPYDLVFMDVRMPELDGLSATRIIRGLPDEVRNIPIVAMTANAFEEDVRECLDAGMDDFVPKPVSKEKIQEVLADYTPIT